MFCCQNSIPTNPFLIYFNDLAINSNNVISVDKQYIKHGIEKYDGVIDVYLHSLIKNAGFDYIPYLFKDGRVLLVVPPENLGLLYPSKDSLVLEDS